MAKSRRRKRKAKKSLFVFLILVLLVISGIYFGVTNFRNKDSKNNDNNDNSGSEKEPVPEVKIVDVKSKSRPFAVMINNLGVARPFHTGLQDAYLVYEIIVEGGITRYMALYKDTYPEVVGSVRSARHYYLDYALENDAYYVHWGWSPQAQSDIKTLGINNINGLTNGTPYFFRQKLGISSEHTGYVNLKEMIKLTSKLRQESNKSLLLNYSATEIDVDSHEDKSSAMKVNLKYSNGYVTNYEYDLEEKVYKQAVNNSAHKDYVSGKQYTVKNIITYKVASKTISGDDKGRQDIDNIGTGEGFYITNGVSIPITWEKKSRSAQTVYRFKNGNEITVNDGNTWIHIVPTNGDISIS